MFRVSLYQTALALALSVASTLTMTSTAFGDVPVMPERGLSAHRGDQGIAPENTIPAFVAAARAGAQQLELDVQKTSDGKLVIMHDLTIDRTTTGKGAVKDLTFDEIRSFSIRTNKQIYRGLKVPTFEEALDALPDSLWINVHVKPGEGIGAAACQIVMEKGRLHQAFFACDKKEMEAVRAICPDAKICCMDRKPNPQKYIQNAIDWKCDFIQLTHNYTAEEIERLKDAGIKINFFGTDDPDKIRELLRDGIDFPLVNRFTEDWPVVDALGGYQLVKQSEEYLNRTQNLQAPPTLAERGLCAHRGDQGIAPENTIPAFVAAAKAGAQQIEFDVQLTKDGKLVIMHDLTVDRTTTGKGAVKDLTFEEIRSFDAGVKTDHKFAGTKVPTFEETLDCLPDNMILNIHIKPGEGIAAAATKVVMEKNRLHQSLISCEIKRDVDEARSVCPDVAINFLSGARGAELDEVIKNTIDWNCQYIQFQGYTAEQVATLKKAGVKINFFGTDDPDKIRELINDGIDFPLVNYFTQDWPVLEGKEGFKLNEVSEEYLKSVE